MPYRVALLLPLLAGLLPAQYGTKTKASEQDYPAHTKLPQAAIGAEYLVHSFSSGDQMYIATDYLVVEVALFPAAGQALLSSAGQFSLRLNERKQTLEPQAAEIVANALKYPDPNTASGLHPTAQLGPWILGQPRPSERFPDDPNVNHGPVPGKTPPDKDTPQPVTAEEVVIQAALPEGEHRGPISGFLYFPYRGRISHIHSLELVYAGPAGTASLSLPLD